MSDLVYFIASRRPGLPSLRDATNSRIYTSYDRAKSDLDQFPANLQPHHAIFTVTSTVQQEVTFEVPF